MTIENTTRVPSVFESVQGEIVEVEVPQKIGMQDILSYSGKRDDANFFLAATMDDLVSEFYSDLVSSGSVSHDCSLDKITDEYFWKRSCLEDPCLVERYEFLELETAFRIAVLKHRDHFYAILPNSRIGPRWNSLARTLGVPLSD